MSGAAIAVSEMSVLRGGNLVVDRMSMTIDHGRWFGLIGANGSGKTSFLRGLVGRLPCYAASCAIDGVELRDEPRLRAARIGFMPPSEHLPAALTCRQLFFIAQPDEAIWRNGVSDVSEAIGIGKLLDRRVGDCSAGMKQRIAIGVAFATGKDTVILDEPFNWLDPVAAFDLRIALRKRVEKGLTLVTALHDMLTLTSCDEGSLIGDGKVIANLSNFDIYAGRNDVTGFETEMIALLRKHSQFA
ncbi:ATP-binding cassette domain-containing protein [Sphingosinicellaceae bacterium]|nr:ATP-binding cassette domain-containing protein [Sphingosinicellaceae bacterium]